MIGDVDDFKQINDTLGHPAGDQALCDVADTLRAGLRASDGAYRLGGDEFALLLPETTHEEAGEVVRRLVRGVPRDGAERRSPSCRWAAASRRRRPRGRRRGAHPAADADLYALKRARSARADGDAAAGPVASGA